MEGDFTHLLSLQQSTLSGSVGSANLRHVLWRDAAESITQRAFLKVAVNVQVFYSLWALGFKS